MQRIPRSQLPAAIARARTPERFSLLTQAEAFLEGEWGRLNPYWYRRAYVELSRNNPRKAFVRYSSDQGTSTPRVAYVKEE